VDSRSLRGAHLITGALVALMMISVVSIEQEDAVEDLISFVGVEAGQIDAALEGKSQIPNTKTEYATIPNFVFRHMAEEFTVPDASHCETTCSNNKDCRSFSYKQETETRGLCVWSLMSMQYRVGWSFHSKTRELDAFGVWHHTDKFRSFPGLMFQEPGYTIHRDTSEVQCQKLCIEDVKCKSFSTNDEKQQCILGDNGVHYDNDFTYYEKLGLSQAKAGIEADEDEGRLLKDERAAKRGERDRIAGSMKKMEDEKKLTLKEIGNKKAHTIEQSMQKHKVAAEAQLVREKKIERHEKKAAVLRVAYNEGYFKAKGIASEKKIKEKDIKALRTREAWEKDQVQRAEEEKYKATMDEKDQKEVEKREMATDVINAQQKLEEMKNRGLKAELDMGDNTMTHNKNLAIAQEEELENGAHDEKNQKKDALADGKHATALLKVQMNDAESVKGTYEDCLKNLQAGRPCK